MCKCNGDGDEDEVMRGLFFRDDAAGTPETMCRLYGELTNCTYLVALKMDCFWPNQLVDEFFIGVHNHYFYNCSLSGRLLRDPPNRILGPFIAMPILVTLLMTALVVWRSKRSEGIV
ncbi:receptor activity-modifying protein 1-like isoform X2 [Entelurus aequoreus]|uniref:receptor activity-modifying protein 1-like isoform X2 n=1 Tax=Entelurus aequoreus TaxID=161455 RepID=UPI002B1D24DF|nr:receptor activity-modifying protein 1-like isoform X2 [Entelurus aequoreus]